MKAALRKQKEVLVIAAEYNYSCRLEKKTSNTLLVCFPASSSSLDTFD